MHHNARSAKAHGPAAVCFVHASGQNVFFGELLEALRHAVERRGLRTERAIDYFPAARSGLVYVFVPHEFLPFTFSKAHPTLHQVSRTIAISSEQPGTDWFERTVEVARLAGGVLDISAAGLDELGRRGIRARRLRLGYVPEWDLWAGDTSSPRPIDVAFLGGFTPRRAAALARSGSVLASRRSAVHLVESDRPRALASPGFVAGSRKWAMLASSKVLLNIHRDDNAYFEWLRAVEAIANGCVVLSERSTRFEPLVPGTHFFSSSMRNLPDVLDSLVGNDELLASVRTSAYELLRTDLHIDVTIQALVEMAEALSAPSRSGQRDPPPSVPGPRKVQPPAPAWSHSLIEHIEANQGQSRTRALSKEVGPTSEIVVERFGPASKLGATVSTILTIVTAGNEIGEAVRGLALSDYQDVELIVVAGPSANAATIMHDLARYPWVPARLIITSQTTNVSTARNLAVSHSSADHVLVLGTEEVVYPHALGRLVSAIESSDKAAFTYGITEYRNGAHEGLSSWLDWNPSRLVRADYIGPGALVDRGALIEVGGYSEDARLEGWEDYDLWCAFAGCGLNGVFVPEILIRRRRGAGVPSDANSQIAWGALLERHPFLRQLAKEISD